MWNRVLGVLIRGNEMNTAWVWWKRVRAERKDGFFVICCSFCHLIPFQIMSQAYVCMSAQHERQPEAALWLIGCTK
jgi:hypothetical protein